MADIGLKMKLKAVDKMSSAMKRVAKSFAPMNRAVDKTNRKFKILQGKSKNLRKSLSKVGGSMRNAGAMMTVGLTAPILGAGAAIIKTSADFQAGMNKVEALTGSAGAELDSMRKMARQLGRDTKFSAGEAANAMAFLGMAGFDANKILSATPGILALAAASGTDLARSADITSNIMGAFSLNADKAGRVADILAKTTGSSNVNMEELAESMKDAGPVALKYGLSLEQTAALVGKLGDAGIKGSKAGTTLKNMMLKIAAPSKGAKKILTALGVNAIDPLTKKLKPMNMILQDLNKSFKDKGISNAKKLVIIEKVFGKRAIAGAGVLLENVSQLDPKTGKLVNTLTLLEKKIKNSNGAAQKMADTMMKGLPGAIARLKSSTEDMLLSFGFQGGLAGVAEAVIEKLIKLTNWISSFSGTTLKMVAVIAGVLAVLGPLIAFFGLFLTMLPAMITGWGILVSIFSGFISIGTIVTTIFTVIAKIGMVLGFVFKAIGIAVAFLLTPLGLVTAAVVGLIALFANLILRWDKIKAGFSKGIIPGMKTFFGFGGDDKSPKGNAAGPELGAKAVTKKSNDFKIRQQKAQIDVNFSNMPKDTAVVTEDRNNMLDVTGTGLMGAF